MADETASGTGERHLHCGERVQSGRREVRDAQVLRADEQLDLRATGDDSPGISRHQSLDDAEVRRSGLVPYLALHQLIEDDVVDKGAVRLVGDDDLEAVR